MSQPITAAEVLAVYRSVLGREPETPGIVDDFVALGVTLEDMITQALHSGEFSERTGAFAGGYQGPPIPHLVPPPLARPAGRSRVAVMIRSHRVDAKFDHLWRALGGPDGGRCYDLFPLLDADALEDERTEITARYPSTVWVGEGDFRAAGLTQRSGQHANAWLLGDLALYCAVRQRPEYNYYVMVEFDVHFTRDAAAYMDRLCDSLLAGDRAADAVGLEYSPLPHSADRPREGWPFFAPALKAFPLVYHFYFPVVAASRQSLLHAFAARQLEAARRTVSEDLVLCESFLPSTLMAAGFSCQDLNTVLPGSYLASSMGLQHHHPERLAGLPLSLALAEPDASVEMVHAVYSDEHFLSRNLSQAWSSPAGLQTYLREAPGRFGEVIAPDLVGGYVERAEQRLADLRQPT